MLCGRCTARRPAFWAPQTSSKSRSPTYTQRPGTVAPTVSMAFANAYGDVYTSEIPWTKPSPQAFAAALDAVGATDPSRCVYVGDRLFDDVWGAQNAGLRAVHLPHSKIPPEQVGHTEGEPDAVIQGLEELPALVLGRP